MWHSYFVLCWVSWDIGCEPHMMTSSLVEETERGGVETRIKHVLIQIFIEVTLHCQMLHVRIIIKHHLYSI